jgi:hypothetical protein
MQFQFEHEMGTIRLRFLVEDPDALFHEYRQRGVECYPNEVSDTSWGTREFALYDPDRNALTFCRDLTSAEKERRSSQLRRAIRGMRGGDTIRFGRFCELAGEPLGMTLDKSPRGFVYLALKGLYRWWRMRVE